MIKINLLPGREVFRQSQIKFSAAIYLSGSLVLIIVLLAVHQFYTDKNDKMSQNIEILKTQLASQAKPIVSKAPPEFVELKRKLKNQSMIFKILDSVFNLQTMGINLREISQKSDTLIFKGHAYTVENIHQFMSSLLSINQIHAVKLDLIKQESDKVIFQIHIVEWDS